MLILKDSTKKHPLEVYLSDNDGNIDIWVLDPTTGEDILIAFLNERELGNKSDLPRANEDKQWLDSRASQKV